MTSRSIGPFGYNSGRINGHFQAVLPTSKSSMHLNLHKNVPDRIRPRSVLDTSRGILAGLKLLDKQKPKMKRFVGIKFDTSGKEQEGLSERLSQFNPFRFPAESKGTLPPIEKLEPGNCLRTYSEEEVKRLVCQVTDRQNLSDEEMQAIVERLAGKPSSKKGKKGELKKPKRFAEAEVKSLVDRLARYDPENWPAESRGKPARERDLTDLLKGNKPATSADIKNIVERLSAYDAKRWPPGSKAVEDDSRDKHSGNRGKKVSESDVDQIVTRLTTYDKKRWPPESIGMKEEFYQGKPMKRKGSST